MCSLQNLSEEYLCDALRLEQRIALLESQASRTISLEVRRKLRRRINAHVRRNLTALKNASAATDMVLRRQLLSCMAETLTRHQYQVCVLNLLEGMTQKEIAEIFGISPSAVSRSISSGQRRLRKALGYHFEQADPMEDFWEEQPYL